MSRQLNIERAFRLLNDIQYMNVVSNQNEWMVYSAQKQFKSQVGNLLIKVWSVTFEFLKFN